MYVYTHMLLFEQKSSTHNKK